MIRHLKVRNLLSLRDASVELPPFGVLIGPNAAGKSNLFRVMDQLKKPSTAWVAKAASWAATENVLIEVTTEEPPTNYWLEVDGRGAIAREGLTRTDHLGGVFERRGGDPIAGVRASPGDVGLHALAGLPGAETATELSGLFNAVRVFELDPSQLRQSATVERTLVIGRRGESLPAVLDTLREEHPTAFGALEEALRSVIPGFSKLALVTVGSGVKGLGFHETDGTLVRAEAASDGTLLLIAILTLVHLPDPPRVICLEEPERGVHPRRLADLVAFLWTVVERGTQVLVATHSPYLLDCFRESRESVIVVDRGENGTRFRPLSDLELLPEELDAPLGEIWYSGVLGGVPGT